MPPTANLLGPDSGPVIQIRNCDHGVLLQNLALNGRTIGLYIGNSAGIRLVNVGVSAAVDDLRACNQTQPDGNSCDGRPPKAACAQGGCNLDLGSMNAAVVVENTFWIWCAWAA
jgi:hypothetical protein